MAKRIPESTQLSKLAPIAEGRYTFERIGEYTGLTTRYLCTCSVDGHQWSVKLAHLLNGTGCKRCASDSITSPEVGQLERLSGRGYSMARIGSYTGSKTRYNCACSTCGHKWPAMLGSLIAGTGCPSCRYTARQKPQEKAEPEMVAAASGRYEFEIDGDYVGQQTTYSCSCLKCSHKWKARQIALLGGDGCMACFKASKIIPQSATESAIHAAAAGRYTFWLVGDYVGRESARYSCTCTDCGGVWEAAAYPLISMGTGCPHCADYGYTPGKTGHLYVLRSECGAMVKVGITNKLDQRHKQLARATPFNWSCIELVSNDDGASIAQLEKDLHARMNRVDFGGEVFDGYTEWMEWDPALLGWLDEYRAHTACVVAPAELG